MFTPWALLPQDWFETRALSTLDLSKLNGFARVIDGSMNFSIMSVAVWLAGPIAAVLSFIVVRRTLSKAAATLVVLIGLVVGLISDLTYTLVDPRIDFEARGT